MRPALWSVEVPGLLKQDRWLYLWAAVCFLPTLFYYYVGEEGIFTIYSMEMWQRQQFSSVVAYGQVGGRPPLYNWLMIPLANLIGWKHVLIAARTVTVAATFGTAWLTGWLAQQLWRNREISALAGLLYLTLADVLLYRGWLAYADPLFAFFIALSSVWLWAACVRRHDAFLFGALLAAFAAFLTKAITVYLFVGVTGLVLLREPAYRSYLLRRRAWLFYLAGLALPLVWMKWMGSHDAGQGQGLLRDVLAKTALPDMQQYALRLVAYPVEMLVRLMPASLFIGYFLLRSRRALAQSPLSVRLALWIALLNLVPYWFAPQGGVRYVLPVYPFVALAAAYLVFRPESPFQARRWVKGMLAVGLLLLTVAYPYYQSHYRGENYQHTAREILAKYGHYTLYSYNTSAAGLSVTAYIDTMRPDRPALTFPPNDFQEGIVLAVEPQAVNGTLLTQYRLGGDTLYLICRGAACTAR
ncbi:MAG: hypothetical protein AB1400_03655 [Pseudomonadota bacterium]